MDYFREAPTNGGHRRLRYIDNEAAGNGPMTAAKAILVTIAQTAVEYFSV
jgi:hypothetical protein